MSKIKKIGFNFFRPLIKTEDGQINYIKLEGLLENIRGNYQRARESKNEEEYKHIYSYNNEPARLSEVEVDVDTNYYHLIFERLDYQVPNRTTLHGDSKALDLDEDEYIGIDVSVLYDPKNHIMMIQRNRSSLGPSGIEKFFRTLLHTIGEEGEFNLAIVSDTTARRRAFNQSAYRKIHLKLMGLKANDLVGKLFQNNQSIGVDSVEITFNSHSGKNSKIDDDFSKGILEEYIGDEDVRKLQIRARESEDDIIEPIDLIDQKLQTYVEFDFREDRSLNPLSVFSEMKMKYDREDGGFKDKILRM